MPALEHTTWGSVPLTTKERCKELWAPNVSDSSRDSLIDRLITEVSQTFTNYLGCHTLQETRTETYELPQNRRTMSFDAFPVDVNEGGVASVWYDCHPSRLTSSDALDSTCDFVVNEGAGTLRFLRTMHHDPGYVRVTYTAGFATEFTNPTDGTGVLERRPELAELAELQIAYLLDRSAGSFGSQAIASVPGAKASFTGQYGLLTEVRRRLDAWRRVKV